jgi:preprotein translocase subunit YajC
LIVLAQAATKNNASPVPSLIFFVLLAGAMYFFFIRPQRARMRSISAAQANLEAGRDVILTSGIYGTVLNVEHDTIGLEIAPGVQMTVARAAVASVVPLPSVADPETPLS